MVTGKFTAPKHIDVRGRDLVKRFLTVERTKRIGCLANGTRDIYDHKWFKSVISWQALALRQVQPPYVPAVAAPDDTSTFESYPESTESSCDPPSKEEQTFFLGF